MMTTSYDSRISDIVKDIKVQGVNPRTTMYSDVNIHVVSEIRGITTGTPEVVFLLKIKHTGTEFCERTLEAVLARWF